MFNFSFNGVPAKLRCGMALIVSWVKTASVTTDDRPFGDVMYCLSPEK
jgi:hypothetical protein